ncbi:alpha/beta fold hydrolase [Arenicella xantha]|uniref:Alpha-beta hydrolase superfamily lysophospholipase n=1 Tax=Arenicella xantha TaxID=644221 RepID=A0A395JIC2_9GAMM|nr:alpha/beta fold hydrolase [Arenicella xantha]RBP49775.1 alpha-beta hydrolase superfamily lysophospholipase [Arenicella xantha]
MKAFEIGTKHTIVFYLHGLRGHAFAQKAALEHMVKNLGVSVISLELPGHGEDSIEEHCMVPSYEKLVQMIVDEISRQAKKAEQVILMGYSFGGALMTLVAKQLNDNKQFAPEVAGLIGISAAYSVGHNVPRWQLWLARIIAPVSRFLYYKLPHYSHMLTIREMDVSLISPQASVQEAINNDELVYKGRIPLNTSAQVYRSSIVARSVLNKLSIPVLLLHSRDDAIALPPRATSLGGNVDLKLFKNLRHNCIDGLARESVIARRTITKFIVGKL